MCLDSIAGESLSYFLLSLHQSGRRIALPNNYRFGRPSRILKHDNDDDGEDAAGSRLAHLLEMRQEDGCCCGGSMVGGIKFGVQAVCTWP
jgi:hypothetical protein